MFKNKVTVIGFKESGKTTYLAGMYISMSIGVKHFSLLAKDPENDLYLERLWEMICKGEKPDPSDRTEKYAFHISHNYKPVVDFDWLDYPGGILAEPNTPSFKELVQNIMDSDCLLLILDGRLFAKNESADIDKYKTAVFDRLKYDTGIRDEVKMFTQLSAENRKLPPVGIVVTKCDLVLDKEKIPKEEIFETFGKYQRAIFEIIRELFESLIEETDRIVLPMSVTLGGEIEPGFTPKPFNIEQPIAFAVLSILMNYLVAAKVQNNANRNYIEKYSGLIRRLINSGKIEKARENSHTLMQAIDKWSSDAFKLIELFSDRKTIYVDGQERNLREYYKEAFRAIAK